MSAADFVTQCGSTRVFSAIPCITGALHAQPQSPAVSLIACCDFTRDYSTMFDARGALDAPDTVPSGGVLALDFDQQPDAIRLLIAHTYRAGTWESRA